MTTDERNFHPSPLTVFDTNEENCKSMTTWHKRPCSHKIGMEQVSEKSFIQIFFRKKGSTAPADRPQRNVVRGEVGERVV